MTAQRPVAVPVSAAVHGAARLLRASKTHLLASPLLQARMQASGTAAACLLATADAACILVSLRSWQNVYSRRNCGFAAVVATRPGRKKVPTPVTMPTKLSDRCRAQ